MTVFYSIYVNLCAEKNMSLSAVAEAIGLSRTAPNGWKKGKQPSDVTLQKLASYFEVDVSVLTGEKEKPHTEEDVELDAATIELKSIWDSADDAERSALLEMARLIKKRRKD